MDDQTRAILDVAPTIDFLSEKQLAFVLGKSLATVRNWRFAYPPKRMTPPQPQRRPNGRIVYPVAEVVAFVRRTGMVNKDLLPVLPAKDKP